MLARLYKLFVCIELNSFNTKARKTRLRLSWNDENGAHGLFRCFPNRSHSRFMRRLSVKKVSSPKKGTRLCKGRICRSILKMNENDDRFKMWYHGDHIILVAKNSVVNVKFCEFLFMNAHLVEFLRVEQLLLNL